MGFGQFLGSEFVFQGGWRGEIPARGSSWKIPNSAVVAIFRIWGWGIAKSPHGAPKALGGLFPHSRGSIPAFPREFPGAGRIQGSHSPTFPGEFPAQEGSEWGRGKGRGGAVPRISQVQEGSEETFPHSQGIRSSGRIQGGWGRNSGFLGVKLGWIEVMVSPPLACLGLSLKNSRFPVSIPDFLAFSSPCFFIFQYLTFILLFFFFVSYLPVLFYFSFQFLFSFIKISSF